MADTTTAHDVEITRLGAGGDGVALIDGKPVFVPGALPGDLWRISPNGNERLSGPERSASLCPHYGTCGGCMSQHMPDAVYAAWKQSLVVEAFRHRGIDADIAPLYRVKPASRRRAVFGIERRGSSVRIGFREEGQHTLVDIEACAVLDALIVKAIPHFREMAKIAIPERVSGRLVVTRLDHGLDVSFESARKDLTPLDRSDLARLARELKLVRLWAAGEPIFEAGAAIVTLSGIAVEIPPGVFLQAVPEAEHRLAEFVASALPKKAKTAVDLFSGVGTLAFPLARRLSVTAFDSDKRAITALQGAVRMAQGLKPIEARVRDLYREPLSVRELDHFDVIVFDPPRAGAAEQAERIAKSKAKTVIAISCNSATLARDARTLLDGGYKMGPVHPLDQFLFSTHIEAATVFSR